MHMRSTLNNSFKTQANNLCDKDDDMYTCVVFLNNFKGALYIIKEYV